MMVLVTYDVNTETREGRSRLRKVAKICVDHGQRVQNSVFECVITPAQFEEIKIKLRKVIDNDLDNLRFYLLGKNWESRVESMGKDNSYNPEKDSFIL